MSILFSGRAVGATATQPNILQKLLRGIFTHLRQAITSLGELAYRSAEDLGITFNRIVDDMQDIENRFPQQNFQGD